MTHDPILDDWLVGLDDDPNYSDYLTLIACVREDMRVKATQLYADFEIVKALVADADEVHDAALRDAAKAVEALHMEWNLDGPDHVCDNEDQHETLLRAVAAIEALGGER